MTDLIYIPDDDGDKVRFPIVEDKRITITEDHIKLCKSIYIDKIFVERGDFAGYVVPTINSKRLFGSSSVYSDAEHILNIPVEEGRNEYIIKILDELTSVLQIFLSTGKMETGTYEGNELFGEWWKVEE